MSNQNIYATAIETLTKAFNYFNTNLCEGKLPVPMINIMSRGRKNALGWHWSEKWIKGETHFAELTITAEYIDRSIDQILETLLHEMAHHYNVVNKIVDCNKYGRHNKMFKLAAEDIFGLIVNKHKYLGWAITELGPKSQKIIDDFKIANEVSDNFGFKRLETKVKYKKSYFVNVTKEDKEYIKVMCELQDCSEKEFMISLIGQLRRTNSRMAESVS